MSPRDKELMMTPLPVLTVKRLSAGLLTCLALGGLAFAGNGYLPSRSPDVRPIGTAYGPTTPSLSSASDIGESFPRPWRAQTGRPRSDRDAFGVDPRSVDPRQPQRTNTGRDPFEDSADGAVPSSVYDSERWQEV